MVLSQPLFKLTAPSQPKKLFLGKGPHDIERHCVASRSPRSCRAYHLLIPKLTTRVIEKWGTYFKAATKRFCVTEIVTYLNWSATSISIPVD